jgi:hypothetical protein
MADFAVGEGDDMFGSLWMLMWAGDLDGNAGFLLDFAADGPRDGFADLLGAAGDGVEVAVGAPDHEELAGVVADERGDGGDDAVGRRDGGVAAVVDSGRGSCLPLGLLGRAPHMFRREVVVAGICQNRVRG